MGEWLAMLDQYMARNAKAKIWRIQQLEISVHEGNRWQLFSFPQIVKAIYIKSSNIKPNLSKENLESPNNSGYTIQLQAP